ncbi:M949_RS01915 family surface polysaccharide biosynthesis protein [Kineosporia succinea]|uniref:Uncharacterized protein n=1 Tax=Kineosporia succinea TaxID=84632 RepID=A0ABT9P189_9ACTN|nr:hypothetical protein [Kineosporia succinea]MDP9826444.1 hypothetical protein [Kineosporia succinea]
MPAADFAPWFAHQNSGRHGAPSQPGLPAAPSHEGPSPYTQPDQGGWAEGAQDTTQVVPPVPSEPDQTQVVPPVAGNQNAATMPLPLIGDELPPEAAAPAAPAAPKKKPVIRRVAAPEPPAKPSRPQRPPVPEDRNAYAPPQNGDIWATFSGPIPLPDEVLAQQGKAPQTRKPVKPAPAPDPVPHGDDSPPSAVKQFFTTQLPEARFVLIAVAGGLVLLLIVLVALLSGRGDGGDGSTAGSTPTAPQPVELGGRDPDGLQNLTQVSASRLLKKAGVASGGTIVSAFTWDDNNGKNLVAAIKVPTANSKTTLKVVQVARLDADKPKVLRSMTDPDLPQCKTGRAGGQAAFAENGLRVRDLDADGYAEVLAGWSSRCGAEDTPSEAKLALVSNGTKYIVRGSGVVGSQTGATTPDPAVDEWPNDFYATTAKIYAEMFFPVTK